MMQQHDIKNKNTILECATNDVNFCLISSNIWLILFRKYVSLVSSPSRKMFDSLLVNSSLVYVFHPFIYILLLFGSTWFLFLDSLFFNPPIPFFYFPWFEGGNLLFIYLESV
jgi:hypothetical protein